MVETLGAWGRTAGQFFGELASRLAAQSHSSKTTMLNNIYGRLSFILVQANARAFNARLATKMDLLKARVVLCKFVCNSEMDINMSVHLFIY